VAYDSSIIAAIRREAARVSDPNKRNRYLRAALQTGIVESGLRNLNYGDADSKGWRQERQSLYSNPTNVTASVRRFFQEAAQHDRGQPSWELAADVQRPAAQYRGRYKDVAGDAAELLGAGKDGGGGGGGSQTTTTTTDPTAMVAQTLLPAALPERPRVQVTAPRAPEFAAKLATATAPGGAALAPPSAPVAPRPTMGAALEAMQRLQPTTTTSLVPGETRTTTSSGGEGRQSTGSLASGGSYSGTTRPVIALAKLAHSYGLKTTSAKRPTVNTASGNVSDHYAGNKNANARDLSGSVAQMDKAAVALARRLGISGYRKGQPLEKTINRGGLRYQILYRTNTGGNHFDHIHVGVAKR
jgi:hypothetical protein